MDIGTHAHLKTWFHSYVDSFRESDGHLVDMLQLKFDHCVRVAQEARELAQAMNWSEGEVRLAEIIGLYHDVGRFFQFREFKTLYDPDSLNHAHCGAALLKESDVLSVCGADHQEWIYSAVYFHNAKQVPDELTGDRRRFAQLARDADKLDNFFLFLGVVEKGDISRFPEIIWNLPVEGDPSPDILEPLLAGELCPYEKARCLADFLLIQVSWVYDLTFPASLKKVKGKRCLNLLENALPKGEKVQQALERVRAYVDAQVW